ncbi:MAG TPA: helix-turn-helix transcriptional regulator [Gemmataceae bacterium]|nr:helix-turn-helix transcriptional regulator [Gemmataceae bacterium]
MSEIGRRWGVTRQAVQSLLAYPNRRLKVRPPLRCSTCDRAIPGSETAGLTTGAACCPTCLARLPEASFAQRLQSLRVARGLTKMALARLCGVPGTLITSYERGRWLPNPHTLARLVRVLGPGLVGGR